MHRTRRRFRGYDYARGGSMFVTICLKRRHRLFCCVAHECVELSEAGEIAKRVFVEAVARFAGFITLRALTIMPDHVHIRFTWPAGHADAVKKIGAFMGRFKQFSQYRIAGRAPSIWEEGYHDLICTSERMNRAVDAYIGNNPLKWWLMHGNRSLMHVVEPFPLPEAGGEDLWRAVGNSGLLELNYIAAAIARSSEGGRAVYVAAPRGGCNQVVYGEHPEAPQGGGTQVDTPHHDGRLLYHQPVCDPLAGSQDGGSNGK